jgi:hypothetical protein
MKTRFFVWALDGAVSAQLKPRYPFYRLPGRRGVENNPTLAGQPVARATPTELSGLTVSLLGSSSLESNHYTALRRIKNSICVDGNIHALLYPNELAVSLFQCG